MSRELVIERLPCGLQAGLLEDGRLVEVDLLDEPLADPQGAIVLGRVRRVDRDLGAAFVDCGLGADAYLGARDARLVAGAGRDQPIERMLFEGQGVLVQVRERPAPGKAPRVSGDIALVGVHLVLRPRRRNLALSARLERTAVAAEQRARGRALFPDGGVTLRRAAEMASDAELMAELARLRAQWTKIETAAAAATPPARIHGVDDPLHRLMIERSAPDLERIVVGDPALLVRGRTWLGQWQPGLVERLVSAADPFEATGAAEQLEQALQPSVPVAGGGSLIIQPTAALTAIDVNGGGRRALEANLAASAEIARQLRLRRIGGTVVVDFIDLPAGAARARVLDVLRDAVAADPAPVQVFGMSRFGLVEISRKRVGPSLAELLNRPCPVCAGAGTLPALRWRAQELLRELSKSRPRRLAVLAAPDLHDYLSREGRAAWQACAGRYGHAIALGVDPTLAPGSHRIEDGTCE
jgi:Rne/Rng family ribonuclease